MTDLVERLRTYNPPDRTVDDQRQIAIDIHEAADEIERLTLENWQLKQACGYPIPADKETINNPSERRAEPNGVANLRAILADRPYLNSVLTVYQILTILDNKGGFMPDEAVVWFREMTLRGDWRD